MLQYSKKHGDVFERSHCPAEKHLHAAAPLVAPAVGSTSPTQSLHARVFSLVCTHVATPSLHTPCPRFARAPVQHGSCWFGVSHPHPGLFLSSGHSCVPPTGGCGEIGFFAHPHAAARGK